MMARLIATLALAFFCALNMAAQDTPTFERVLSIFETSCSGSSCHSEDATHPLKLVGDPDLIYEGLLDVNPLNPAAVEKGNKMVVAGEPHLSFLYRKINAGLYADNDIAPNEGGVMPAYAPELESAEKEIIRQWIMHGAPREGVVHNESAIQEFYAGGGMPRIEPLEKPDPSEGFQIHLGTIFLEPGEETEVLKKQQIPLGDSLEIVGMHVWMHEFSHHYGISKFEPGFDASQEPGILVVDNLVEAFEAFLNSTYVSGSQNFENFYILPENTAFRWEEGTSINLNYHIKNYATTGILPAEAYVNFFTQPRGTSETPMETETITYSIDNPFALQIHPTGTDTVFTMEYYDETSTEEIDVWSLTPHTHQYGVDFDIFLRNADGSKGEKIYEGFYNYENDFNQGFFDYSHATTRYLDEPYRIKVSEGLIFEGTYNNATDETVGFGMTTEDEMFIGYFLYTKVASSVGLDEENIVNTIPMHLSPNPYQGFTSVQYQLEKTATVGLELYDIQGKLVKQITPLQEQQAGTHQISMLGGNLASGTYLVVLNVDGKLNTAKLFVQ